MAATYGVRQLYGGALTVELPVELIDSSDIRQIPDHQEVFLSPTTLTSIIFEINTHISTGGGGGDNHNAPSQAPTTRTEVSPDGTTTTTTTTTTTSVTTSVVSAGASPQAQNPGPNRDADDHEATKQHFTDVISPPDTLVSTLPSPQPVKMLDPSLARYPAYMLAGNINTVDDNTRAAGASNAHAQQPNHAHARAHPGAATAPATFPTTGGSSASHAAQSLLGLVHQIQLLVRLPDHGTDIVVRVAVPLKEFARAGQALGSSDSGATEGMIAEELGRARDLLARVVGTLKVRDWGLLAG
ncbi:hypothetical protein G647_01954 [Cladophialophora carrionii CBS 160.54]|uniref:Uncharacterized protein n=1 Tax=Cladophialophora carrionii CBS 160.54 TaxID=1279043 RepID=V9DS77_9EURO|nr:uncharacterized protein G647_01954 [Cladophialophora carrionii CBS 160.54]ETI29501.1 hypothetical protein G647_01954 [Cladophialophora carrionii CBS 160.54]